MHRSALPPAAPGVTARIAALTVRILVVQTVICGIAAFPPVMAVQLSIASLPARSFTRGAVIAALVVPATSCSRCC